jgi:hypothetical protein
MAPITVPSGLERHDKCIYLYAVEGETFCSKYICRRVQKLTSLCEVTFLPHSSRCKQDHYFCTIEYTYRRHVELTWSWLSILYLIINQARPKSSHDFICLSLGPRYNNSFTIVIKASPHRPTYYKPPSASRLSITASTKTSSSPWLASSPWWPMQPLPHPCEMLEIL